MVCKNSINIFCKKTDEDHRLSCFYILLLPSLSVAQLSRRQIFGEGLVLGVKIGIGRKRGLKFESVSNISPWLI